MSVVLFPPPFYFVFYISNLLSYIQNNFSYELARSPHNGNHFSSNNNNYHNKILQTGFLGVYRSDRYVTYTLVTNFPEIVPVIMALALLCGLKSPRKKYGNK